MSKGTDTTGASMVRFYFWTFTFLPVIVLFIQLGPVQFSQLVRDVCTVDRSITPSSIVKDISGYAIIDRLYVYGGTPYIVADGPADLAGAEDIVASSCSPSGETTVSRCGTTSAAVKIVTVKEAREIFGRFIHKIPGVAFLSTAGSLPSVAYLDQVLAGLWGVHASANPPETAVPRKLLIPSIENTPMSINPLQSFLSVETKSKWEDWARTPEARRFDRVIIAYNQK